MVIVCGSSVETAKTMPSPQSGHLEIGGLDYFKTTPTLEGFSNGCHKPETKVITDQSQQT